MLLKAREKFYRDSKAASVVVNGQLQYNQAYALPLNSRKPSRK